MLDTLLLGKRSAVRLGAQATHVRYCTQGGQREGLEKQEIDHLEVLHRVTLGGVAPTN